MFRAAAIAALVSSCSSTDINWTRYPGFVDGANKTDVILKAGKTLEKAAETCKKSCDAGPTCDCSSFEPASGASCAKDGKCRNDVIVERGSVQPKSVLGAVAYATTEDLTHKMTQVTGPVAGSLQKPDWKLNIDDSPSGERQTIDGFGAAWTDATVTVFSELSEADQEQLMEDLFGTSGIGLSFMRHTIGQSDLTPSSIGRWSYDENGGQPDPDLAHFDFTDNGRRMVSWLKRMYEKNPNILLLGSQWSPPGWMKGSNNQIQGQYIDAWVTYMVKYLHAAKGAGVKIDALTIQNEPLHSGDSAWTMYVDKTQAVDYTNRLTSKIGAAGLETQIWAYDHNTDVPEYPAHVIENSAKVNAVAWHCYSSAGWAPLTDFHKAHPGVKQYMTECWTHLASGEGFFDLPGFIHGPIQNYARGALSWVLGGSSAYDVGYPGGCGPCSGIIQVDRSKKSYVKTQDYYKLGQFSKFVKTGATYLNGSGDYKYWDGTGVSSTHYRNPNGDLVVVISNKIKKGLDLQIDFKVAGSFWGFVPARSVTTWVLSSKLPPALPVADPTCGTYCASSGCAWTAQYSCPWQAKGSKGYAGNDGSTGYNCCCGYQACNLSMASDTIVV